MTTKKFIEIGCAPCTPRPDTILERMFREWNKTHRLRLEVKRPYAMLFGDWDFDYSEIDDATWDELKPFLWERIKKLYAEGQIRYGCVYSEEA